MRDINRIPEIIEELEKVWRDNPDFRLGQLITVVSRPSDPHPTTFYIEDDKILEGLKSFGEEKDNNETSEPIWIKHSVIGKTDTKSLSVQHLRDLVLELTIRNEQIILTPESVLGIIGAPISDKDWMKNQKTRLNKIKQLLAVLESEDILNPVQVGYEINKVPNKV